MLYNSYNIYFTKFIIFFSKVIPNFGPTVTKVTVGNLVGPHELLLYKKI